MAEPVTVYGKFAGGTSEVPIIIDSTDTEAFLVRKDGDGGDIFVIDTSSETIRIKGSTPTLAFGDGDSGFLEASDDTINIVVAGANKWSISGNNFASIDANGPRIDNVSASNTVPTLIPDRSDPDLGIGSNAAGDLSVISGGAESGRFDDDATAGNTRFLVYDVDNATLERVSVGAADSGGAGYKVLRIPN